jgi:PqqD family protein of HPr-rel-A system
VPNSSGVTRGTRFKASSEVLSTSLGDEVVLLDPASGEYFGLEGVGAHVWTLLEPSATLADLIAAITAEYEIDSETCEHDLRELLERLLDLGLVRVVATS